MTHYDKEREEHNQELQQEEVELNAHLIAAAPEMYNLLESLAEYDENQMHKKEINDLLAKARGDK